MINSIKGKKIVIKCFIIFATMICIGYLANILLPAFYLLISIAASVAVVLFFVLNNTILILKEMQKAKWEILKFNEAWHSIYHHLQFSYPLQQLSSFSIAPDFANYLIQTLIDHRPKVIVELGCGTSTIINGLTIKKYQLDAKIIAIESDVIYLEQCKLEVVKHELQNYIEFIHAPLQENNYNGNKLMWYNFDWDQNLKIDLLIIDGPPEQVAKNARYPAYPKFVNHLANNCILLADDAARADVKATVNLWKKEYPSIKVQYIPFTRGAYKITS